MSESAYLICFDFPDMDDPVFAGWAGEQLGIAWTMKTAARFESEEIAARWLENNYGAEMREWGTVVEAATAVEA